MSGVATELPRVAERADTRRDFGAATRDGNFAPDGPATPVQLDTNAGRAASIYRDLDDAFSPPDRHLLAHIKRFMELILGDPAFRDEVKAHRAREAAVAFGVDVDPDKLLPLYDSRYASLMHEDKLDDWPHVKLWKHRIRELLRSRDVMRQDGSTAEICPQFDQWRQRQMRRNDGELGQLNNDSIVYPLVTYELSKGCTIGCWFCGISAERFQGYFPYTAENARLWREVLNVMQRLFGTAMSTGFCYWATDPMDNPDYPRFLDDYHRVTGAMPQTTTAAPMRDVALTREVMEMQRRNRTVINRFSITSLRTLRAVHAEFTADELLDIELVMQHKEAITAKALAGDALISYEKLKKNGREGKLPHLGASYGTIACVAGFLVNMIERSVMLVSPCRASARFPKGYKVYARASFETAGEFEDVCHAMIRDQMPSHLRPGDRLAFRADLQYAELSDGFRLENEFDVLTLEGRPFIRELGALIAAGTHTAGTAQDHLLDDGADFFTINRALQDLFDAGLLAEPVDHAVHPEAAEPAHA